MDAIGKRPRTTAAVALGGGGARGLAHLGAMEAIGESGIQTEQIVGVSIGSLIGGMYAANPDIKQVQANAIELLGSPMFSDKCKRLMGDASGVSPNPSASALEWFGRWYGRLMRIVSHGHRLTRLAGNNALLNNEILVEAIEWAIPDIDLQDTSIPFSVVAIDLKSGRQVVLERGSLRKAILASTAIPGFFPPIPWDDYLLCDVGVVDSIPVSVAKSYALPLTIAIDVGSTMTQVDELQSAIEIVMRMEECAEQICRRHALPNADVVIRPDVGHWPWYDFTTPQRLIDDGRKAGRYSLDKFHRRSHLSARSRGRWQGPNLAR
ncbi:MAG: patatin-like phospholipase family protein [Planctomycetota bacterium]